MECEGLPPDGSAMPFGDTVYGLPNKGISTSSSTICTPSFFALDLKSILKIVDIINFPNNPVGFRACSEKNLEKLILKKASNSVLF